MAFHIKNFFFIIYLLEDEQELSLGMLDTSPMYLNFFIVPCYYITCFGCLMGFTMHFYIIFWTNLLTGGPVQIVVFCPFQCFTEKEYQTESKRNETFGRVIFATNAIQETWSGRQGSNELGRRAPHPRGPLIAPPTYFFLPKYTLIP